MQAMLTNTKNSGILSVQADQIGRTYSPQFTINLLKEEEILDDLKEISVMEYVVQVIMIIVYVVHLQDCLLSHQLCPTFPPAWKERGTVRL